MKKYKIHFTIILIILILIIIIFTKSNYNSNKESNNLSQVCFNKNCFSIELAITQEEKQIGLMNRNHLDKDKGMLFIYTTPQKASFWMKNTLIPLDIIWIDQDFNVVYIANAQSCKQDPCPIYNPDSEALYILEINSNLTKELNIKEGDKVSINLQKNS